jgi:two-component system LytT family response regulator
MEFRILVVADQRFYTNGVEVSHNNMSGDILRFAVKDGFVFIRRSMLIHAEGSGSYTFLYLDKGVRHIVSKNIGQIEKLLEGDEHFFRCHNSHIINLDHVERFFSVEGNFIQLSDGSKIPVARRQKNELFRALST